MTGLHADMAPPGQPVFAPLRERFLHLLTDPQVNAACRLLGGLFFEMVLEHSGYWPAAGESSVRAELRAIALDLRDAAAAVDRVEIDAVGSETTTADAILGERCPAWAAEALRLAERIENASRFPGPG